MSIRKTRKYELPTLMAIYAYARSFMAEHGNAYQWGHNLWPHEEVVAADIESGRSYVIVRKGEIVGAFYFHMGEHADPCYDVIDGSWEFSGPYGVIHRIASSGKAKGVLKEAVEFALERVEHVRIDTHADNTVMRDALLKLGFKPRGIIHVEHDSEPRTAYER